MSPHNASFIDIGKMSPVENPTPKRRRVVLACVNCRDRKVKCDGQVPNCATCVRRNETCVYRKIDKSIVNEAYVKDLERRLGIGNEPLSESRSESTFGNDALSPGCDSNHYASTMDAGTVSTDTVQSNYIPATVPLSENDSNKNSGSDSRASLWSIMDHKKSPMGSTSTDANRDKDELLDSYPVDAMGAGSPQNLDNFSHQEFYGSSSAMSFMRALLSNFDLGRTDSVFAKVQPRQHDKYSMRRSFHAPNSPTEWILPLRRIAKVYVDRYFRDVFPLYPFLHKPTFMATYESVWDDDGKSEDDDLFYCIMNLIFALGVLHNDCQMDERRDLSEKADTYFERSEAKLTPRVLSHGSLVLLQVLLLKSQYLQATRRAGECWNVIGLSIRVAQSLGIHLNQVISSKKSVIEQEMCKRLWHGCVMMDIVSSMTFGRPSMGTLTYPVDFPCDANDHFITDEGIAPSNEPSHGSFFVQSLKLYAILEQILQKFYSFPVAQKTCKNVYCELFTLEESLDAFEDSLPFHLKLDSGLQTEPFQRQATVLRVRYLHVKIMLYKALSFSDALNVSSRSMQVSKICKDAESSVFDACLDVAIELIDLFKNNSSKVPSILPALWYNVYYVYTCTTVLLVGKMQALVDNNSNTYRIEESWIDSANLLKTLSVESESAAKCLQHFQSVNEQIEKWRAEKEGGNSKNVFEHDILLPFAYGEFNFFQSESQFPG